MKGREGVLGSLSPVASSSEAESQVLIEALRRHDERAFVALLERFHGPLLRLAMVYCPSRAVAEEVVQETWLGVLQGIDRFEGRSSLKTWIYSILIRRARTRARKETRSIPFSAAWEPSLEPTESAGNDDRFVRGQWAEAPRSWGATAEERLLTREAQAYLWKAIEALPPHQREVITLRDVEGWTSEEVCNVLNLTETNQRVLLHRARTKVRRALEAYFR